MLSEKVYQNVDTLHKGVGSASYKRISQVANTGDLDEDVLIISIPSKRKSNMIGDYTHCFVRYWYGAVGKNVIHISPEDIGS